MRTWNVAIILGDVREDGKANEKLRAAIEGYEMAFGIKHPQKLESEEESGEGRTSLYSRCYTAILANCSIYDFTYNIGELTFIYFC